ncbi:MAG: hypothetical protein ACPG4T_01640, partial [Nannocystaceae bacterium]
MDRLLDRLERAISRRRRRRIGLALSGVAVAATAGIIGAYTNFNRPAAPAAPQPCEALERQLDGVWDGRIRQAIG